MPFLLSSMGRGRAKWPKAGKKKSFISITLIVCPEKKC